MKPNIVHQGRGGYIEVGTMRFEIEMQMSTPHFCIYFPRRAVDKTIKKAKSVIEHLIQSDPEKWELAEYDGKHGLYDAMTVNERLFESGLSEIYEEAIHEGNKKLASDLLREVEVPESDIEAILGS